MSQVVLSGISKRYSEDALAVNNLDLTVQSGEFMVLLGPSGCGKSTTLRMVAGLESITKGELKIGDRVVNDVEPQHRDIAMVFQNYALYPHMNVFENMAFGLKIKKMPAQEINQRVADAAQILGLEELLHRRPKELSGGQRQRVAMGRAIVRQPQVFLFDEPLSNLDAQLRLHMRLEISLLHQQLKTTTLYVTHDQVEAMTLASRIAILDQGVLQQVGTPMAIYNTPANRFVAGFIGSPPMNFIKGEQSAAGSFDCQGGLTVSLPQLSGRVSEIGVRPQALRMAENGQIAGVIELVERLGAESYVHFRWGGHAIVAQVPSDMELRTGEALSVDIEPSKIHCFDADGVAL
jgi:multiple sugar transport system ATP-binding protein